MTAVAVKAATEPKPSFEAGAPIRLFDAHVEGIAAPDPFQQYDVTVDGKRFLVNTNDLALSASPPLTVVVNWQAGLKK